MYKLKYIIFFICLMLLVARAAEASITLRVVAVNPSEEFSQTVSVKVYLPLEVKPEDVIAKQDLDIAYDTQQGSYYVFGEYELKPKEVLEKEVEIKDIWVIPEAQLLALHKEAQETFSAFEKTAYAQRASGLYKDIEKKLGEIEDLQKTVAVNPSQHISDYRYCMSLLNSTKADLLAAKTLLAEVTPKGLAKLTWKIILFIIIFLGILSFGFYIIWQRQARLVKEITPAESKEDLIVKDLGVGERKEPEEKKPAGPEDIEKIIRDEEGGKQ